MIVGHGDIASVLGKVDKYNVTFFASGVSNSQEEREEAYAREKKLLEEQSIYHKLVYFGSLSVFYSDTRYARHKREMEVLVQGRFPQYAIIRLGNITWGDNPHTLINFIRGKIKKNEPFEIRDEYRYIIDKEEFLYWMKLIPPWNCEMNLTGRRMKVAEIVNEYGYLNLHS